MVLPILNYGCEIWGFHPAPNVEAVHLKFLKQLLKLRSQTSSAMVYGELGRVPLIIKRKERILKYWLKIKRTTHTLLKNAYLNETQMMDNNIGTLQINTWTLEVKNMLNDLGFSYLWTSDNLSYSQIQIVIKRLNDQYIQKWFADLSTMPKLCTYNMYKTDPTFEKYLECVTNTNHRTELARLRCSSHNLETEIGRYIYNRVERQNRVCIFMNFYVFLY